MSENSTVESSIIVFSGFPACVKISQSFVNFKVVKGNVSNDFLLNG